MSDTPAQNTTPAINAVLSGVLRWTALAAVALIVLGGGIGFLVAGSDGLWSGLAGVGLAIVFLALTPISMLIANRFHGREMFATVFFGIVMGGWLLKLVIFIAAIVILRGQSWIVPVVIFLSLVAGIVVSLVVDAVAFTRLRVPHASDVILPARNPEEHEDS